MRKLATITAAVLASIALSTSVATAEPTNDRYYGNAERSNCQLIESTYTRYLIRVYTTRVYNAGEENERVASGWVSKSVRTLPAKDSGIVFKVVSSREVTEYLCLYPTD